MGKYSQNTASSNCFQLPIKQKGLFPSLNIILTMLIINKNAECNAKMHINACEYILSC